MFPQISDPQVYRQKMTPKVAELTDRFGNTFHLGNAGDYWHPALPIGGHTDYRTHVRKIRDIEIRPDDVLICSFPKTGLHWNQEIIRMLMRNSAEYTVEGHAFSGFLDGSPAEIWEQWKSPRVLITHVPFRYVPKQAFEKKIKIVYLDRNPKDVLVSYYNHMHSSNPPINYPGTFEHFYNLYFDCGFYYGDIFDYLMDWQRGMEANPDVHIYTSVFEDMKLDPVGGVKKLNEYLATGCSDELCEKIANACDFKAMKAFKDANATESVKTIFKDGKIAFYRKGDVGDWKNWFTVAMNEHFEQEFKKRLSDYKTKYKFTL